MKSHHTLWNLLFWTLLSVQGIYAGGFLSGKAAADAKHRQAMLVVEGKEAIGDASVYGFMEFTGRPGALDVWQGRYLELRAAYSPLSGAGPAAEYNGDPFGKGTVRLGAAWSGSIVPGNYTVAKCFPWETAGTKGAQASLFVAQDFGPFIASLLGDYNLRPQVLYTEATLEARVAKGLSVFMQARGGVDVHRPGKTDIAPYVGVSYTPLR